MVSPFTVPILLNVFNRPDETERVLSSLGLIEPAELYVHCDGPRNGNEEDVRKIQTVQEIIDRYVSWPCKLYKLYETSNLGCGRGPAKALNWFFSNVEEGIVLEDDCIPNKDFFYYCQELLCRFRNDSRIGIISGTCFKRRALLGTSYFFTAYAGIWGWATWKRTWDLFDFDFYRSDHDFVARVLPFIKSSKAVNYWLSILHRCVEDGPTRNYWDYQLHLCLLFANKIHISPNCNLVSNIGFNENATHTLSQNSVYANKPTQTILPLTHPRTVRINHRLDNKPYEATIIKRIKLIIKTLFR